MNIPARSLPAFLICLFAFGPMSQSQAQTNAWTPAAGTTNSWETAANWSLGTVPNAQNAAALFSNAVTALISGNITIGSLSATASGNVVVGSTATSSDILTLDSSTGSPVINSGTGSIIYMYADLDGTNGYTKTGAGTLDFYFSPNDQLFNGPLVMAGGTLVVKSDGHFGGSTNGYTNALIFASNSTVNNRQQIANTTLTTARPVIISNAATASFQNILATGPMVFNGPISGAGNLQFITSNGSFTLNASNSYTGNTTLNNGAKLILGPGANISTNGSLTLSGTAASSLDLGGNSQTIASYVASFTNGIAILSNGSLLINSNANATFGALTNGAGTDLSGLSGFSYIAPTRDFTVSASATTGGNPVTNTVTFAASGINRISAATIQFGNGANLSVSQTCLVKLGQENTFNATNSVLFGLYTTVSNSISFGSSLVNPSLKVRGATDANPAPIVRISSANSGAVNCSGALDLTGGTADIWASDFDIAAQFAGASTTSTGTLTMPAGTLVASNLSLGRRLTNPTSGSPTMTGTVNQLGGSVQATNLYLGFHDNTNAAVTSNRYVSTYNLDGGSLKARYIGPGGGTNFATNSSRQVNWTGGEIGTVGNSTNLTITGTNLTGGALTILTAGSKSKAFSTNSINAGSTINIDATTWLVANGGDLLIDLGPTGVLNCPQLTIGSGNNANTTTYAPVSADASITVASGTANFSSTTRIFALGDRSSGGSSSLLVTGGTANLNLSSNRMLIGNKTPGIVDVSGGALNLTNNNDIYVGGDFAFGATNSSGVFRVSGGQATVSGTGKFVLAQNSTNSSGALNSSGVTGTLQLNGGVFATSRRITPGTNGVFTAAVNLNGGTLRALTNQSDWISVANINVQADSIIDTGTNNVGIQQILAGGGGLTKSGSGNLTLSGSNSYTGLTSVQGGNLVVVRTNLTATISSNTIAVTFTNTNSGTFPVLSGPLGGTYTGTVASTGLNTNQTAMFDTTTGTVTVAAAKQAQTITGLASTDTKTYGASAYTLSVTKGASSSPLTFESGNTGVATVSSEGLVTIVGAGSTIIRVNQAGDANYLAASEVSQVLTVTAASQTAVSGSLGSSTVDFGGTTTVTASGGAGTGAYEFRQNGGTGAVSFSGTGTTRTISTTTAGTALIEVRRLGDANYTDSSWVSAGTLTVNAPAPTGPTLTGTYPGSTPLGVNPQNGLTYLMSYALGGDSSNAPTLPSQVDEAGKLALVAVVRTNDTNVSVVGEVVGSLADYSNPSSITALNGTTNYVPQTNLPAGCERRKYSVDQGSNDRQFLRLKAIQK